MKSPSRTSQGVALAATLARGLEQMALPLFVAVQERLLAYVGLLVKWSRVYNLTAVREPAEVVTDSLSVAPHLRATRFKLVEGNESLTQYELIQSVRSNKCSP